jgi:hypothetical protein
MSWTKANRSTNSASLKVAFSVFAVIGLIFAAGALNARAQSFTEAFNDITTLTGSGWFMQNNSGALGSGTWFQGNPAVFPAQAGATNAYLGVNFNSGAGTTTISNWMLTPNRTFNNGDTISFWTRTTDPDPPIFPDRLQVRLSTAGASTNVGTGPTAVGDFTTLLLDINPTYTTTGYPSVWTQMTITLSGLPAGGASGRIAFRYFVENGGTTGANSDYIGIDTFAYTANTGGPAAPDAQIDYNGDGKSDWSIVRPAGPNPSDFMTWWNSWNTIGPVSPVTWGIQSDEFVPADYDGDTKDDIAVYRAGSPSTWYILNSNGNTIRVETFGQTGDDPSIVADYTADNKDDIAVYRINAAAGGNNTWFYKSQGAAFVSVVFGTNSGAGGDFPAPGDYDGDNKADFVVQRNQSGTGVFYKLLTTGVFTAEVFGNGTELIVPGDYDGDGKTDVATAGIVGGNWQWNYRSSMTGATVTDTWGVATDIPIVGNYCGDNRSDYAVWRSGGVSTFFAMAPVVRNICTQTWGTTGDLPVGIEYTH